MGALFNYLGLFTILVLFKVAASVHFYENSHKTGNFSRVCYYHPESLNCTNCLTPDKIDLSLCTHIITGFASVVNASFFPGSKEALEQYKAFTKLKSKAPNVMFMLSVGGGDNAGSFSDMVSTSLNRQRFINQSIEFLRLYKFDGIDFDWEFPAWKGSPASDKDNFVYLLKELQEVISFESLLCRKKSLLVSVAVCAAKSIIPVSYDIPAIALYSDFINLMSYDYHFFVWYDPLTGHNSPLYKRSTEVLYFATENTAWSANYWATNGMPKKKIMVGLPTYGHTYTLLTKYIHGFDAPAVGYGMGGGNIDYDMICNFLKKGANHVFDEESQVPYAYLEKDWIAYDDIQSFTAKSKFILEQHYGGAMTFNLNADDWRASCDGNTTFPLHRTILKIFNTA